MWRTTPTSRPSCRSARSSEVCRCPRGHAPPTQRSRVNDTNRLGTRGVAWRLVLGRCVGRTGRPADRRSRSRAALYRLRGRRGRCPLSYRIGRPRSCRVRALVWWGGGKPSSHAVDECRSPCLPGRVRQHRRRICPDRTPDLAPRGHRAGRSAVLLRSPLRPVDLLWRQSARDRRRHCAPAPSNGSGCRRHSRNSICPPHVPSTYIVCSRDGAIPPEAQFQMAQGLDRVVVWPTDHSPFLTRPGDVADLLELTLTARVPIRRQTSDSGRLGGYNVILRSPSRPRVCSPWIL